MVSHSTTRKFKCMEPFSDKDFTHKSDLVKHERTYSGIIYKCGRCNYSNLDERNYTQHLRYHTKDTLYSRKTCGEHVTYTMELKRHRLSPKNICVLFKGHSDSYPICIQV